jgi:hypothetical protein
MKRRGTRNKMEEGRTEDKENSKRNIRKCGEKNGKRRRRMR